MTDSRSAHGAVYARMGRNVAWLLGGRGFQGVASLAYLALAARAMGPQRFGDFSLILAYGQGIANFMQFQSWQAVIRYGSAHVAREDRPMLARLLGLTTSVDLASAVIGALAAIAGVGIVGHWLGWNAAQQGRAALFGAALLLSIGATPNGVLRLFDRFDLLTYCQAVGPIVRLAGSLWAWAAGYDIDAFLIVWAAAALIQSAATWIVAFGRAGQRPAFADGALRAALRENERIGRFLVTTNLSSSLSQLWEQVGTLGVGSAAGAAAAGGFRIANRVAKALAKPVQTLSRVLFPELARLIASDDRATLRRVSRRVTIVAFAISIAIVAVAGIAGPLLLHLLAGKAYRFAHALLFLLAIASAIEISGFVLEPLLTAHGRAGAVLLARTAGTAVYALLLWLLLGRYGAEGAAFAAIGGTAVVRLLLTLPAARVLNAPSP